MAYCGSQQAGPKIPSPLTVPEKRGISSLRLLSIVCALSPHIFMVNLDQSDSGGSPHLRLLQSMIINLIWTRPGLYRRAVCVHTGSRHQFNLINKNKEAGLFSSVVHE